MTDERTHRRSGHLTDDLNQLVDRTLLVGFEETEPPDWLLAAAPHLGAVVLYGQNLRSDGDCARLAAILQANAGDQVLLAVDEEGGDVTRLHYHSGSPSPGNRVLGIADDLIGTTAVAGGIAARLRAAGIRWDLAPDVDVNCDPDNPVIGVRSFGADPGLVARHSAAWIRGLQAANVAGCAKHFPGHGDTRTDSHLALPTVTCDERQWRRWHLPPFVAAIDAGVRSIMTGHLLVPALDQVPATLSRRILHHLLRGELGFDGVVVTDALEMAAISETVGIEAAAVAALAAGADALCLGASGGQPRYQRVRSAIRDAVTSGELPVRRLEDAAERVDLLRSWTAATAQLSLGLSLARRAAATSPTVPALGSPPVLIELRGPVNLAVGNAAWDLGQPLRELGLPPRRTVQLTEPDEALRQALAEATGHPLVVVGRDVPRHRGQLALWRAVLAARPDAVLIDVGLPRPAASYGGTVVLVAGAARPNLRVAAELLVAGVGPAK